ETSWADALFGKAMLGDARRTKRLTKLAADMAASAPNSVAMSSLDPASLEGAYRFIANDYIKPEHIAQAGFEYTDSLISQRPLVLALQDTTGLSYKHAVCDELGEVNSASSKRSSAKGRTLYAHSTLMLDAERECVLGLANQHYWFRQEKQKDSSHSLQCRAREEKESYKWQRGAETLASRLGDMSNVIDVCDREADMYEYLGYQMEHQHRFVVRSSGDRKLAGDELKLRATLDALEPVCNYQVHIASKGGRPARDATIALSHTQVTLPKPQRATAQDTLTLNVVYCREMSNGIKDPLCWVLYTTEPLPDATAARKIVRYYELRWRIEEFHRIWKSEGTQVEELRMQTKENVRRTAVIKAFIAVRLLQLKEIAQNREEAKTICCETLLSRVAWRLLWNKTEKKAFPEQAPSLHWAYYALARLGRWHDRSRNGRVGTQALWRGWLTLMDYVESYEYLKEIDG
ncbi:MAG: IS4 family transposase, partial [Oceanisphaera sp.]|uniref:IS4 family transposase n=1 Tax=Oceanisphaera sp. TaxID=1929979 RepID=UPI003C750E0B